MSLGTSATPLGRVRGLGASGEGGEHWLHERVTSLALLLLGSWLLASLLFLPSLDQATVSAPPVTRWRMDTSMCGPHFQTVKWGDKGRDWLSAIGPGSSSLLATTRWARARPRPA